MKTRHLINHQRHGQAQLKNVPKKNNKKEISSTKKPKQNTKQLQ